MNNLEQTSFTGKYFKTLFSGNDIEIFLVNTKDVNNLPVELGNKKNTVPVIADFAINTSGELSYKFFGSWKKDDRYGIEFIANSFDVVIPTSSKGIIKYLSSGEFKGIGKKTAEKIVSQFGENTIDVLQNTPEKLYAIKNIKSSQIEIIKNKGKTIRVKAELNEFFAPYQLKKKTIDAIYSVLQKEVLGDNYRELIINNPYKLLKVSGCSFGLCDEIAKSYNSKLDSYVRIKSGIEETIKQYCLRTAGLYMDEPELRKNALFLLNKGYRTPIVSINNYVDTLERMRREKDILNVDGKIYLAKYNDAELYTSRKICKMLSTPVENIETIDEEIAKFVEEAKIKPSAKQIDAIKLSLCNRISIITGGPGTGKTTIINGIIKVYKNLFHDDIVCLAPTGKAARRMSEATNVPAMTIHSRLGIYESDSYVTRDNIDSGLIIIDEVSMVDTFLMRSLMSCIDPERCQLVLVGDQDQLPSVGAGAVLSELISSNVIPTTKLTEIFRQNGGRIITNAQKINTGETALEFGDDFQFIEAMSDMSALEAIKRAYKNEVDKYGVDNVAILSPLRKAGSRNFKCTCDSLNRELQSIVNPRSSTTMIADYGNGIEYHVNDRVMMWKNRDEASNGDIGIVKNIVFKQEDESSSGAKPFIDVDWGDGTLYEYGAEDVKSITLAYAISVYKSQGSEYASVIIPCISEQHCQIFKRNMLYTAITRAKKKVVLVGDKKEINTMIIDKDNEKRKTLLGARINKRMEKQNNINPQKVVENKGDQNESLD